MIENFEQMKALLQSAQQHRPVVCVAAAADRAIIEAVKALQEQDLAEAILTGDESRILRLCQEAGVRKIPPIIAAEGEEDAAQKAAALTGAGGAQVLMKGQVNSSVFLRAVLREENGLRSGGLLCHLAVFQLPDGKRLQFHTDGGMNLFPDLEKKRQILELSVAALHRLGIECPNVAALSANEIVNPKVPSSVDAAQLQALCQEGAISGCVVEGPVAMDVALSCEAAAHKGIQSRISGRTDLFLMPNIEAGNLVGKALMYCAGAKMAGVVLGAACPVVMTSRADGAEAKLNSLVLALALCADRRQEEVHRL